MTTLNSSSEALLASPGNHDNATMGYTQLPLLSRPRAGWKPDILLRLIVVLVLICVTLIGNVSIVVVLTCAKRYRKHVTRVNVFIVGLAVGDLTVCLFTMTTEVLFFAFDGAWVLGPVACKLVVYVQVVTMASATFILTAMSCDRYVAICHPLRLTGDHVTAARRIIAGAWLLAAIFASPQLFIFLQVARGVYADTGEVKYVCASRGYTAEWQRKVYFSFMTSYILVLPLIVITFCYVNVIAAIRRQCHSGSDTQRCDAITSFVSPRDSNPANGDKVRLRRSKANRDAILRAKIRTIKMTLCIICGFVACWSPYFIAHLADIWTSKQFKVFDKVFIFTDTIAMMNSVLNPIIYGCFNLRALTRRRRQRGGDGALLMKRHHHSQNSQRHNQQQRTDNDVTTTYFCRSCHTSFDTKRHQLSDSVSLVRSRSRSPNMGCTRSCKGNNGGLHHDVTRQVSDVKTRFGGGAQEGLLAAADSLRKLTFE